MNKLKFELLIDNNELYYFGDSPDRDHMVV